MYLLVYELYRYKYARYNDKNYTFSYIDALLATTT